MDKTLKKRTILGVILLVSIFLTLNFIFSNSFEPTEESLEKSNWVLEKVEPALEKVVGEENVTTKLVRKLAHFFEFFLLGTELVLLCTLYGIDKIYAAFVGLLAAVTDETIQIFSERGSQLTDVLIDFGAVLTALVILVMGEKLLDFFKSR